MLFFWVFKCFCFFNYVGSKMVSSA